MKTLIATCFLFLLPILSQAQPAKSVKMSLHQPNGDLYKTLTSETEDGKNEIISILASNEVHLQQQFHSFIRLMDGMFLQAEIHEALTSIAEGLDIRFGDLEGRENTVKVLFEVMASGEYLNTISHFEPNFVISFFSACRVNFIASSNLQGEGEGYEESTHFYFPCNQAEVIHTDSTRGYYSLDDPNSRYFEFYSSALDAVRVLLNRVDNDYSTLDLLRNYQK